MKLLPRKQAGIETQKQKKALVDEGVGLATRVDALRETVVKEEGNLERFRKETISIAQSEIDAKIRTRDSLIEEIRKLEQERVLLQMPLDEEWDKVKSAYLKYADQVGLLESSKQTVAQQIGENTMLAASLEVERGRIAEMKRITEQNLLHADDDLKRAREESAKMRNVAQTILASAELRETIVIERERNYQATITWCEEEKTRFAELDKDLTKREKVLADRYATLERTLKRK
jgi:hypothetical protein